ncbi:N-acyl homoserine lactonase family protein [Amycolatopsis thermophila]|uniref:Glyoxylase-like metal-dependent hydrolase (Beta-lactamase superfamily II) n=1 Tax=Amycolatopsis thermophila TaxID=206084 RepID=A0ABU0F1V7_9PSEU|nr:N-acyl homoserine lactonase family protein [Amycolatopsis thermophila]MDQ0381156.1 glyoxylase-like metal-dependent hydrolase (beta-lactamase superfamily II) [Amycolatopsis thermophila]
MSATKLHLLDLGRLTVDDGFFIRGCGCATRSEPAPQASAREVAALAAVVEHPTAGPILFDTGCARDAAEQWPAPAFEAFPVTTYDESHHLDKALEAAGFGIGDIQAVVMSHLHLDHAGGLEHFLGTDVPVYVHEQELREQYYAIATKEDFGAYVPGDLHWQLNWQAISRDEIELAGGVTLRHMPGHTPGSLTMQVDLDNSGTFLFTGDLFHVRDLFEQGLPQGWLNRNSQDWWNSVRWMRHLQKRHDATLVYGHDATVLTELKARAEFLD